MQVNLELQLPIGHLLHAKGRCYQWPSQALYGVDNELQGHHTNSLKLMLGDPMSGVCNTFIDAHDLWILLACTHTVEGDSSEGTLFELLTGMLAQRTHLAIDRVHCASQEY